MYHKTSLFEKKTFWLQYSTNRCQKSLAHGRNINTLGNTMYSTSLIDSPVIFWFFFLQWQSERPEPEFFWFGHNKQKQGKKVCKTTGFQRDNH